MCAEGGRHQQDGGDVQQDQERLLSPRGVWDGGGSGAGGVQQWPESAADRAWESFKETVKNILISPSRQFPSQDACWARKDWDSWARVLDVTGAGPG